MIQLRLALIVVLSFMVLVTTGLHAATPLIAPKSNGWKYQDQGLEQGQGNWRSADYDDNGWSEGQPLLGYGDRDIRTKLSFGGNPQNKRRVAFFRRPFFLPRKHRQYLGRICCDDGAVVYLNGKEVQRFNMPGGAVTEHTQALAAVGADAAEERQLRPFLIEGQLIQDGENLIAVSVHQANPTSSDLAFDLELVGLDAEGEIQQAESEVAAHAQTERMREANVGVSPVFHLKVKPR
ncbi:MAG: hypothetical protein GY768_25900 [Planctomycetaceae bacterium]|nr:hypothetical protein [Planctomycetaceae bacterium]